jgi:hypothetical protein
MLKISLTPLEAAAARVLAAKRGVDVASLINALILEEAAIDVAGWRDGVGLSHDKELPSPEDNAKETKHAASTL